MGLNGCKLHINNARMSHIALLMVRVNQTLDSTADYKVQIPSTLILLHLHDTIGNIVISAGVLFPAQLLATTLMLYP